MQLHVIVIGAQTQRADTKKPYTVRPPSRIPSTPLAIR